MRWTLRLHTMTRQMESKWWKCFTTHWARDLIGKLRTPSMSIERRRSLLFVKSNYILTLVLKNWMPASWSEELYKHQSLLPLSSLVKKIYSIATDLFALRQTSQTQKSSENGTAISQSLSKIYLNFWKTSSDKLANPTRVESERLSLLWIWAPVKKAKLSFLSFKRQITKKFLSWKLSLNSLKKQT